jgi:hypothetical protein
MHQEWMDKWDMALNTLNYIDSPSTFDLLHNITQILLPHYATAFIPMTAQT